MAETAAVYERLANVISANGWERFIMSLIAVADSGYGQVILTVKNGRVAFIQAAPTIRIDDAAGGEMLTGDDRK